MIFAMLPGALLWASASLSPTADRVVSPAGDLEVNILEPVRPKRSVVTRSGFCGAHEYQTELRDGNGPGGGAALSARVNGKPVPVSELGRALTLVPGGFFLHEARIAECDRGAPQARIRVLAGSPSTPKPLWISFLLSADGKVTGERLD